MSPEMNHEEHAAYMERFTAEKEAKKNQPMTRGQGKVVIILLTLLLIFFAFPVAVAALKYLLS